MGNPSFRACCRSAPTVRFIAREMAVTGVLALECLRSSLWLWLDQARLFVRLRALFFLTAAVRFAIVSSIERIDPQMLRPIGSGP